MKKTVGCWAAGIAACLMLFLFSARYAAAFQEPDTGITKCYDADGNEIVPCPGPGQPYYGQDGNLVNNGMNFTDNKNGTLLDNVTQLVWQQGSSATAQTYANAVAYCDSLSTQQNADGTTGLGGFTDWRVPALVELNTLLDLGVDTSTGAAAIPSIFSGTASAGYWTSTVDPDDSTQTWVLNFGTTEDSLALQTGLNYVRCVRGATQ